MYNAVFSLNLICQVQIERLFFLFSLKLLLLEVFGYLSNHHPQLSFILLIFIECLIKGIPILHTLSDPVRTVHIK